MASIFWKIANKNPYIALQCEGYARRHNTVILRRWWYLIKILCKNRGHYFGEVIGLDKMRQIIDQYDVISFDIFDTLLIRPYNKPTDLFWDLENRKQMDGFAENRIKAEQKAREHHQESEDITLDQIYQEIEDRFKDLKEEEMFTEEEVLTINPSVYEVYQYALRKRKNIIICSDMYLPKDFLEAVLYKNGYYGFSEMFVSSDILLTKGSGNLYKYVLKRMKVSSSSILHIGDNFESDGNANRLYGIAYICVHGDRLVRIGEQE